MKVLVTVNITKGFDTWLAMSQTMTEEAAKNGIKMIWAATNPDETSVFVLTEMQDPAQMKTFGEREDIAKARAGGRDRRVNADHLHRPDVHARLGRRPA